MKYTTLLIGLLCTLNISASSVFPEIDGWNKSDKINTYDSETLWEYINGAAEYYLGYNFSKLEWIEYSLSEDIYIKAEIYHHTNPINAFGIYAYERTSDGEFLDIGNEAYLVHSSLNFYIDKYYIKIYSHKSDENTIKAINEIAEKLAENIMPKSQNPEELLLLPKEGLVAHSEKYMPSNFLGYSFFKNVVTAKYLVQNENVDFFAIEYQSNEDAVANLEQYLKFLKSEKQADMNSVFELDDTFNGKLFILITDKKLIGVIDASNKSVATVLLGESNNP